MLSTCSRTLAVASWNPGYGPHPWPWSAPQGGATSRCPTSKDDRPVRPCVSREGWRAGGWGSSPAVESLAWKGPSKPSNHSSQLPVTTHGSLACPPWDSGTLAASSRAHL